MNKVVRVLEAFAVAEKTSHKTTLARVLAWAAANGVLNEETFRFLRKASVPLAFSVEKDAVVLGDVRITKKEVLLAMGRMKRERGKEGKEKVKLTVGRRYPNTFSELSKLSPVERKEFLEEVFCFLKALSEVSGVDVIERLKRGTTERAGREVMKILLGKG